MYMNNQIAYFSLSFCSAVCFIFPQDSRSWSEPQIQVRTRASGNRAARVSLCKKPRAWGREAELATLRRRHFVSPGGKNHTGNTPE